MDLPYYFEKICSLLSNCKRKRDSFVLNTEIQKKTKKKDLEVFQTPNSKYREIDDSSSKLSSISFCERLFQENAYATHNNHKKELQKETKNDEILLNNNFFDNLNDSLQLQCNPKALNYENSEDLFKVMERFSELINDFKDLKVDKLPPIKNYEDNNKFNISEVKSEKDNHALFQLYQNIVENFLICKSKEEKQKFFARISFEDFIEIHSLWNYKGDLDLEIKKHDFMPEKISYKNLQTLAQKTWLNDEVINSYVRLILRDIDKKFKEKIRIFNTFFYTELEKNYNTLSNDFSNPSKILRIAKKFNVDILCNFIYIPVNIHNNHWLFLEINLNENIISYFDSFSASEKETIKYFRIIEKFLYLMEKDSKTLNKSYKFYISKKFPRQENMSDCGVFMLKGIHYKVKKEENMFNQNDIPYFRMLITLELLKGRLLETV